MISALDDRRTNNFDALRVIAALMVIYGHGCVLSGGRGPGLWGEPFARAGLDIFFSISGYLVTGSWYRAPRPWLFLAKRARRIFPGLITCVLVTIIAAAAFATRLPAKQYFASAETWQYLTNIILLQALYLPGVFIGLREMGAVNGSLWSLFPEWLCYLTVPFFAVLTPITRLPALALSAFSLGAVGLFLFEGYHGPALVLYHMDLKYALVEAPFFFVGGLLWLLEQRFDALYRADLCLAFLTSNYMVSSWLSWGGIPLAWFTVPYMAVTFGRLSLPVLNRAGRFGDLSYGLYLYAFPIQQVILARWPDMPHPVLVCAVVTCPAAFMSWHLVERPALHMQWPRRSSAAQSGGPPQSE